MAGETLVIGASGMIARYPWLDYIYGAWRKGSAGVAGRQWILAGACALAMAHKAETVVGSQNSSIMGCNFYPSSWDRIPGRGAGSRCSSSSSGGSCRVVVVVVVVVVGSVVVVVVRGLEVVVVVVVVVVSEPPQPVNAITNASDSITAINGVLFFTVSKSFF